MVLTYCYNRVGFFSLSEWTEETTAFPTLEQAKKVFAHFKKNRDTAIKTDNYNFSFENYSDWENGVVCVKYYAEWNNCTETKMSIEKAKKVFYGLFAEN